MTAANHIISAGSDSNSAKSYYLNRRLILLRIHHDLNNPETLSFKFQKHSKSKVLSIVSAKKVNISVIQITN